ncbi:hypothetical protein QBC37DRAFT_354965 [Rhypophila decipiens]|uniref:Clr5 domain-containing protein n=1 Tax=Rhypophila decipiens TaxID=261697 RepID=A0AAN6XXQ2_9PEZI|nr:hypothetical protein QBC37DRAFT_354965 [Rhypophila decipiens]
MFRPAKPEDWEPYRELIAYLYTYMKLKDVMEEMQNNHHFKATEKQYKTQLKKWNLDTKYTKASEYIAMIKIQRQREAENPPKQTRFALRGRPVDPKDITRFEKRALKKGMIKEEDLNDGNIEEIEELAYDTPTEEINYSYADYATTSEYDPYADYQY